MKLELKFVFYFPITDLFLQLEVSTVKHICNCIIYIKLFRYYFTIITVFSADRAGGAELHQGEKGSGEGV